MGVLTLRYHQIMFNRFYKNNWTSVNIPNTEKIQKNAVVSPDASPILILYKLCYICKKVLNNLLLSLEH